MVASQMSPQCAPPSDRPSTDWGLVHHLADGVVVVVDVARERREQQRLAVALEQPVEGDLLRWAPRSLGDRGDARFRRRLVVGRVAEREDLLPATHEDAGDRAVRLRRLRQQLGAHLGMRAGGRPARRAAGRRSPGRWDV